MTSRRHFLLASAAATMLPLAAPTAQAQAWPQKPIKIIVAFAPQPRVERKIQAANRTIARLMNTHF